ncbi:DUF2203 family protein [Candidatus Pacearchaeota archaeon]|nr:DUF2203 family protein [Candidatus Pacearchaeota archaeon]
MKGKPRRLVPNYTVAEAVNMLPYIKSYCRDLKLADKHIRKYARLARRVTSMVAINDIRKKKIDRTLENIGYRLDRLKRRIIEWYTELEEMSMVICNVERGAIDVPIYVEDIDNVVYMCVVPNTNKDNIEWHSLDEGCDCSRSFKWMPIETD